MASTSFKDLDELLRGNRSSNYSGLDSQLKQQTLPKVIEDFEIPSIFSKKKTDKISKTSIYTGFERLEGGGPTPNYAAPQFDTGDLPTPLAAAGSAFNVLSNIGTGIFNRLGDVYDVAVDLSSLKEGKPGEDIAKFIGALTGFGAAGAGALFAPISAELAAAEELPIVKYPAKLANYLFTKADELSGYAASSALNALPISNESKEILLEPVRELGGIIGTLGLLKVGMKVKEGATARAVEALPISLEAKGKIQGGIQLGTAFTMQPLTTAYRGLSTAIIQRIETRKKNGEEITPEISRKIVNESVKEIPIEIPGVMEIPTVVNVERVHTNHKLVLQNYIKGLDSVEYKYKNDLGKNHKGEPINAKFEWDYGTQKGTMLVTNKATAANLAHEIGHYFDVKLNKAVRNNLTDILPQYIKNKEVINDTLTKFAIERIDGDVTKSKLDSEILKISQELRNDIKTLAVRKKNSALKEQFATAFEDILIKPETSQQQAPTLFEFINTMEGAKGLMKTEGVIKGQPKTKVKEEVEEEVVEGEVSGILPSGQTVRKLENTGGEKKVSKLAKGVEQQAIENKLTESFNGLPEYQTINVKEQAQRASEFISSDIEAAKRVALGKELPPPGVLPEAVFTALESMATKTGNIELLRDLATLSSLSVEASAMGQRIRLLGERNPNSAVSTIQEVVKARELVVEKKQNMSIDKARLKTVEQIKKNIPKATPKDWSDFIESIKC